MSNASAGIESTEGKRRTRITAMVDEDMHASMLYWAKKQGITINELLRNAVNLYISYQNKDYDLPSLEIQRLNQLTDLISTLSYNIGSLEKITVAGFDSLISLTRGDNYLLEPDDGEIDDVDNR